MNLPLKWEFPGGKIKENESEQTCLQRELFEELNIEVLVKQQFASNLHRYPDMTIHLIAYLAELVEGTIIPYEHRSVKWFQKQELSSLEWADADRPIVMKLLESGYL